MRVALVSMPFGMLFSPSIALGTLKRVAEACGCETSVHYFGFPFARDVGVSAYNDIAARLPTHSLVGEWIFSSCLSEYSSADEFHFAEEFIRPLFDKKNMVVSIASKDADLFIDKLNAARRKAPAFVEACADILLETELDVVGLTTTFQQNCASLALAKRIKERSPNTTIVLGGANCEEPMGSALAEVTPWLDYVVSGEGETAFETILKTVSRQKAGASRAETPPQRKTTVVTSDLNSNLDSLPVPDYSDFFEQLPLLGGEGTEIGIQIPIETARGCWWGAKHHCTFCGLNGQSMTFRSKTADRALEEICAVASLYPESKIALTDNILDMKYFSTLLPMLADRKIEMNGFWEVKANLSRDQLQVLRNAGVQRVQPGIESFSANVLKTMHKGVRPIQNLQFLVDCVCVGISPSWNILWGFAGETARDYEETARLLPNLFHLPPPVGAGPVGIHRFSPMFQRSEELGVGEKWPAPAYDYVFRFAGDRIADIAYFFDGSYALSDQVKSMTAPIKDLVAQWKAEHDDSVLISIDNGKDMVVLDSRSRRKQSVTRLNRQQMEVLSRAKKAITRDQLTSQMSNEAAGELDTIIDVLVDNGFLAALDGWYLTLVLDIEDVALNKMRKIEALMATLRSDRQAEDVGTGLRLRPEEALA